MPTCLRRWNRQSVLKRRHIKFRRRGITQKKTYSIQNMTKVWNQEQIFTSKKGNDMFRKGRNLPRKPQVLVKCPHWSSVLRSGCSCPSHKGTSRNTDIAPLILTPACDRGEWSASCPSCFTPREEPQYPQDRRLGGPQTCHRWFWSTKNSCSCQDSNPRPSSPQLVTILTICVCYPGCALSNQNPGVLISP
jgi:hypothetical protein